MSDFKINGSLNEYAFARFIEDYNESAVERGDRVITATQGRDLHAALLHEMATAKRENGEPYIAPNGSPYSFETSPRTFFVSLLGRTVKQTTGIELGSVQELSNKYNTYVQEYSDSLGWGLDKQSADDRKHGNVTMNGYVPISPFDERYAMRSTMLSHGTEILYAKTSDIISLVPNGSDEKGTLYTTVFAHDDVKDESKVMLLQKQTSSNDKVYYRNAGSAYTNEDASGLARMRPYLSDNDYKSIAGWMAAVPPEDRMTRIAMERSVGILQMLQEEGIPYKVSKDRNPGQIKAEISNTKISVRLSDTRANEGYVGRVYKDGHSMFYNTLRPDRQPFVMSVSEVQALVKYAIGGHPDRFHNTSAPNVVSPKIGAMSTTSTKTKGVVRTTYVNGSADAPSLHTLAGFSNKQPDTGKRYRMMINTKNNHSSSHRVFNTKDDAAEFLKESVDSARNRFMEMVNVDYLIEEAKAHADDDNYTPLFSSDSAIAPIQQNYWDVLHNDAELYRPTDKKDDKLFNDLFEALGLNDESEDEEDGVDIVKLNSGEEIYSGTAEENVRAHLNDSMDVLFGTYEENQLDGKRFNPSMVSAFMESPNGIYRNNDNLVAAMYKLEFTGDEVRGDDFQTGAMKDRLLRFDESTAKPMSSLESPFMQSMFDSIKSSIQETACRVDDKDILIDDNGVVHYTAYQFVGQGSEERMIQGQLGQIFEPDNQGIVETKYNGSSNKLFTPGYDAFIVPETPATAGSDLMERVRLRGLEQIMKQNISESIRYDLLGGGEAVFDENGVEIGRAIGTTTNINNTYRGLYSTAYKVSIPQLEGESLKDTYIRQTEMTHLPREVLDARFETAAGLIHFDKDIAENSTVAADFFHNRRMNDKVSVHEITNDNSFSAYELTGRSNMAITQNHSAGYTDPVLTGSGKNQGIVRYLARGAQVTSDGRIVPSEDKTARAPLMYTSPMRYCDYIPADRVEMVGSNYLTASGVAGMEEHETRSGDGRVVTGVGIAQLTLQGFTFDDGAVISKDFAEQYGVISDGELRPLMEGDKICDFAGNKSIIAKVIDRNMPLEEAREKGVETSVKLFAANPDLDIVQAPYSAVSRFNAASAKLAMENTSDLVLPDGTVHEGCIGFAPVSITKHTANEHTKLYSAEDDEPVAGEKGRKISAQLGWLFSAKGSKNMMDEIYSGNNSAVSNYREVLNVMGLDMDEVGTLREGYEPHPGEERYIFKLPDAETLANTEEKDLVDLFRTSVDSRGGFLEIPFEMTLPSGVKTQPVPPEQSSYPDRTMYQLPVLSAHMRSGQTFEDGTSMTHDYTNQYTRVFTNALKYLKAEEAMKNAGPDVDTKQYTSAMYRAKNEAETSYASITDDLKIRKFETKHNSMRDDFMAKRMPHSATAVWTPDTNLGLNEIAMNSEMMKNLGVKHDRDDHIMVWRDPILRDYGARYLKVKLDDNLCGVAVNPLVAVAFDGDFDGDSVGMWKPSRESSKREAMEQFSIENTMLDTTQVRENGDYKLIFNVGMDVVSAEVADEKRRDEAIARGEDYGPTLKERRLELEHRANEIYRTPMTSEERLAANREVLDGLSDWAKDTLCDTCGTEIISYKDLQSHAESLVQIVDHGAKGNHKKLGDYFKYYGAKFEKDDEGHILPETMQDTGNTLATEKDVADTELATAIKSHGTGNAGAVSQRVVTVMRNRGIPEVQDPNVKSLPQMSALSSALQLTYLSTQGILQAKHDPIQAQRLYEAIQGSVRDAWKGYAMEAKDAPGEDGQIHRTWHVKREINSMGESIPIQATKEDWVNTFMDIHTHKDGLDLDGAINIEQVKQVAEALYDEDTGLMMNLEDEATIDKYAAPMDILAYRQKDAFAKICTMAKNHVNVYEGTCNRMFMPKQISRNVEAKEMGEETQAIQTRDTRNDYDPVNKKKAAFETSTIDKESAEILKLNVDSVINEKRKITVYNESGIDNDGHYYYNCFISPSTDEEIERDGYNVCDGNGEGFDLTCYDSVKEAILHAGYNPKAISYEGFSSAEMVYIKDYAESLKWSCETGIVLDDEFETSEHNETVEKNEADINSKDEKLGFGIDYTKSADDGHQEHSVVAQSSKKDVPVDMQDVTDAYDARFDAQNDVDKSK